ncbi:MAG: hypothetical protein ACTSUX_03095 [Promethearchaeota archaeon]
MKPKNFFITTIVILSLGIGLIPGGILINISIDQEVQNSIDEGLLGIREEALPMIESMVAEMGIPRTLRNIREIGLEDTEALVNATFFMFLLNMTLHQPETLGIVPISLFFDKWIQWVLIIPVTFSSAMQNMGYPPIKGISEYFQQDLWYGNAKYLLLEGYGTLPGLIGNNSMGTGVLEFLELYDKANGNLTLEQELAQGYNTTWNKLSKLTDYYRNYFVPIAIPMIVASLNTIMPEYAGLNTKQIAEKYFYEQWANCSLYEEGIDFSTMVDEIKTPLYGFEVGHLIPSNITRKSVDLLWDDNNLHSLTNDTGINDWIEAIDNETKFYELCDDFYLEKYQMNLILNWLWNESFKWNIVPALIIVPPPLGEGMTLSEYAEVIFYEVWANGTADNKVLYPYGFPLELRRITVYGFEIGYQNQNTRVIPSNISLESARLLWNISNEFSLVNKKGLQEWLNVLDYSDSAAAYGLQEANQLTKSQMGLILKWLSKFRDNVMPYLAQEKMDLAYDSKTLGNIIQMSSILIGGALIGTSGTFLIKKVEKKPLR